MRFVLSFLMFALFAPVFMAQNNPLHDKIMWLHPNEGQWNKQILYKAELNMGEMYLEKNGFLFNLSNEKEIAHVHDDKSHGAEKPQQHAIRATFIGSSWNNQKIEKNKSAFYRNYFLGTQENWKSEVHSYQKIEFLDIYPGINLDYEGLDRGLKYSFTVTPGSLPDVIQTKYEGSKIFLDEQGNLHISTVFGDILEEKPIAWTIHNGRKTNVEVKFHLENNIVTYEFPNNYNNQDTLVIDPILVFSTFTGAGSDNWGFTATPDLQANTFGAGIVFGPNYPVTTGAFDPSFNNPNASGGVDIGISKFSANGNSLIYSTFLGGSGNETPNSIICAPNGELYVFGITGSANFPTTAGALQFGFAGGASFTANGISFPNGSDIYVTRMNAAGTGLIASTYIGGSQNDGNNSSCNYNYGDQFRGEIILSGNNVYITSSTRSSNFPGTSNALHGNQDAILFSLNNNLSSVNFARYFGGINNDAGYSLQLNSTNNIYMAGATASGDLNFPLGEDLSYNGGNFDGYVAQFNSITGNVISGTYMGTGEHDQTYFVQLDLDDAVYVFGQSEANFPITPGKYGNPNSGQFIRKYNANLTSTLWTTMIGASSGHPEISPTAFLVSDCYDIYFSGWGGTVNSNNSSATFSSSNNFPVTSDAYQSATNGNNFYIAVLSQDAAQLKYATYFGSLTTSSNHLDGGTSRFDKNGRIYHAVCGACGGNDFGFTTTPGAYSQTNNSSNCNMAVFKFKLSEIQTIVNEPNTVVCIPDAVTFTNNTVNGNTYFWDFGDGNTSTSPNPSHVYSGPGNYTINLIVTDSNNCFSADTLDFDVEIGEFNGGVVQPGTTVCPGDTFRLEAYGGSTYSWSPANLLDDPNSPTPLATVFTTTTFTVIVSDTCGSDTLEVVLDVFDGISSISNDTSICIGNSVDLFISGGTNYQWSPPLYLNDPNISNPTSTPLESILYTVEVLTTNGCVIKDSVDITVYFELPEPQMPNSFNQCIGDLTNIQVSGAESYLWSPNQNINTIIGPNVSVGPSNTMYYYCDFTNACGTVRDSVLIEVRTPDVEAFNDTIVCPGSTAIVSASGVNTYEWFPSGISQSSNDDIILVRPLTPTYYVVEGTDIYGCIDYDSVLVDLFPQPKVIAIEDQYVFIGDQVQLNATSNSNNPNYIWSPEEYLSCVVCADPLANPNQNFSYTVTLIDENFCEATDIVNLFYDPIIYVPNTFTPNSDEFNVTFGAKGGNIKTFEMLIFNRWGEVVAQLLDLEDTWDGTYLGEKCQDGTYTWKIRYTDFYDTPYMLTGHVNLLR